jgi:hypothetical protein
MLNRIVQEAFIKNVKNDKNDKTKLFTIHYFGMNNE